MCVQHGVSPILRWQLEWRRVARHTSVLIDFPIYYASQVEEMSRTGHYYLMNLTCLPAYYNVQGREENFVLATLARPLA